MQSEEKIQRDETPVLLNGEDTKSILYPVDAEYHKIDTIVRNGGERFVMTHFFKWEDNKPFITRQKAIERQTERMSKTKRRVRFDDDDANEGFYDATCGNVTWKSLDGDKSGEFSDYERKELPVEEKSKAVDRLLESTFTVLTKSEQKGINFLFDKDGVMKVEQSIGDEDSPDYTLIHTLKRPDKQARNSIKQEGSHLDSDKKGKMEVEKIVIVLDPGIKFFHKHFISVEGVMIDGVPYKDEHKATFLQLFNPEWMAAIAGHIVTSFGEDEKK